MRTCTAAEVARTFSGDDVGGDDRGYLFDVVTHAADDICRMLTALMAAEMSGGLLRRPAWSLAAAPVAPWQAQTLMKTRKHSKWSTAIADQVHSGPPSMQSRLLYISRIKECSSGSPEKASRHQARCRSPIICISYITFHLSGRCRTWYRSMYAATALPSSATETRCELFMPKPLPGRVSRKLTGSCLMGCLRKVSLTVDGRCLSAVPGHDMSLPRPSAPADAPPL